MSDLDAVLAHIDADFDNALDRLFQTVRMKSISTDPAYAAETRACAEWHAADLASIGFAAEVRVVEPLGPHTLVTTTVAGQPFRAILESTEVPRPGDVLTLAPAPDRIRWFNPETQAAL